MKGFCRAWRDVSFNMKMGVMMDMLRLFRGVQEAQRSMTTLPDFMTKKRVVVESLDTMLKGPYPGGSEEENAKRHSGNPDVFTSH